METVLHWNQTAKEKPSPCVDVIAMSKDGECYIVWLVNDHWSPVFDIDQQIPLSDLPLWIYAPKAPKCDHTTIIDAL